MWPMWPCNTWYKSVVDCVVTSDGCLQSAPSLLFQQLSCGWTWSAFYIPVSLLRAAGDSDSLLLEDILESILPPQPGLCFELSTMAKSVIAIQYLSKIIIDFTSDDSNTQIWVSAFCRYTQRSKEEHKSWLKHIITQLRWFWQRGYTWHSSFIEEISHSVLQCYKCASQHKDLRW